MKITLLLACVAFSVAAPAIAATPTISGKYALSYVETCQATISYTRPSGKPYVSTVNTVRPGHAESQMMLATFNSATHMVTGSGYSDEGDLLIIQNVAGGKVVKEVVWTLNNSYSNSATQITVAGSSFHVVYARIVGAIAYHADFIGIPSAGCVAHGTLEHQ